MARRAINFGKLLILSYPPYQNLNLQGSFVILGLPQAEQFTKKNGLGLKPEPFI